MLKNMLSQKTLPFLLLVVLILAGCATGAPRPKRVVVQIAEKRCLTYDCYMERLGDKKREESVDKDGNTVIRWYMSVRKTRPLEYGEEPLDGRYYRYYNEDCWFTAVFAPDGAVLNTDWKGPGCWGRGS